jgi:hypothetical protein
MDTHASQVEPKEEGEQSANKEGPEQGVVHCSGAELPLRADEAPENRQKAQIQSAQAQRRQSIELVPDAPKDRGGVERLHLRARERTRVVARADVRCRCEEPDFDADLSEGRDRGGHHHG